MQIIIILSRILQFVMIFSLTQEFFIFKSVKTSKFTVKNIEPVLYIDIANLMLYKLLFFIEIGVFFNFEFFK
jgi:hypothetical protein